MLSMGCAKSNRVANDPGFFSIKPSVWTKSATKKEHKGDLQGALYDYRVAKALSGKSRKLSREIERLKKLIKQKTEQNYSRAEKSYKQGKLNSAKSLYQEVLRIDPWHQKALRRLTDIHKNKLQLKMEKKVALSQRHRMRNSKKSDQLNGENEGYVYSRQAILQTENRATNVTGFIEELEKHIKKYPKDNELKNMLMDVRVVQARVAFKRSDYDRSLFHLTEAENALKNDSALLKKLSSVRKKFGKELYLMGVRTVRTEPVNAVELWKIALRFDPTEKRAKMRLDNLGKL
jgi:tetratricopeptide (TPR) repeat protein